MVAESSSVYFKASPLSAITVGATNMNLKSLNQCLGQILPKTLISLYNSKDSNATVIRVRRRGRRAL